MLVTAGATEALAGALLGMLDTGDEVVVFEPMYDSYQACIALAGARPVPVLLRPGADGRYHFDPDELRAAVTPAHPADPAQHAAQPDRARCSTPTSWRSSPSWPIEHDLVVVTDEVYEHLVFPGATHVPIATLPGMAERTLTISSGGKTFNTTGWKIGWMCGPARAGDRGAHRQAVPHLRQRRARSSRRSPSGSTSATTSTPASPPT